MDFFRALGRSDWLRRYGRSWHSGDGSSGYVRHTANEGQILKTMSKICGINTDAALNAALVGGADYIGLVFFAKSPRNVTLDQASALAKQARGRAGIVALTVDASDAALTDIIHHVSPGVFQLHGHETPERAAEIGRRYGRSVWKALPVETAADAEHAFAYLKADPDIAILFDAKAPKGSPLPGGNGLAFDWRALDTVKGRLPFMLSGGLTPENVAGAIRLTSPALVDVSSGVESRPGVKDPARIGAFLKAVRNAGG